jgi:hypothetical protein
MGEAALRKSEKTLIGLRDTLATLDESRNGKLSIV